MALIGILVMAIGGAAVWYWRLKMAREAGSEIIDTVEKMRGAYKRRSFWKKAEVAPIASIRDPAIAAVAFFMCLANEKPMYLNMAKKCRSRQNERHRPASGYGGSYRLWRVGVQKCR